MQEVGPSGVTGNEASRDVEAGMVVEREQESLFFRAWPPLVDGTVVLEEFPESSTTKAAVGAWFFGLGGNKAGEMSFDVGFDAGSGAFEAMETEEFVGNELKIAGGLERNEFAQEGNDGIRPRCAVVTTTGVDLKSRAVFEPTGSKLVEAGFSYMEKTAGFVSGNASGIEFKESLLNEMEWESVGELAFFMAPIQRIQSA